MSEQLSYFARDLIEQGEDFVVARVVETSGSTPRKKGAVLMMKKDGTTVGTVGAACWRRRRKSSAGRPSKQRKNRIYMISYWMKSKRVRLIWGAAEMHRCR